MKQLKSAASIQRALMAMAGLATVSASAQTAGAAPPVQASAPAPDSAASAAAAGASAPSGQLGTVTITGIRGSMAKSVATKREAEVVMDSIAAEDIGKLPQQNIAESLQRVTGVQIARSNGEGQKVSVRGLDPKFTQVLYNGRQLPSASGSRSFDFSILSADFIRSLDVYKSPMADTRDGGLAATINVLSVQPLYIGKQRATLVAEGINESNAGGVTPHLMGFYSNVFADNKLGLAVGIDYRKRKYSDQRYEGFGFEKRAEDGKFDLNADGDKNDTLRFNHASNFGNDQGNRDRVSLMGALQYRVNDDLELRSDLLYSRLKNDGIYPVNSHRFTYITGTDHAISARDDGQGNLSQFDSDGVDNRNNARTEVSTETLQSIAFGGKYTSDRWTLDGEVSTATSKARNTNLSLEVIGRANVSYDYASDMGGIPTIAYQRGYDPFAPGVFRAIGFNGQLDEPTEDKTTDARLDATYELGDGFFRALKFGAALGMRRHTNDSRFLNVGAQALAGLLGVPYDPNIEGGSFDGTPWMRQFGGGSYLSGYGGGSTFPTTWMSADPYALLASVPLSTLESMFPPVRLISSVADVKENTQALYVQTNFASADEKLSGNVGLRYVRTTQETLGFIPDLSSIVFDQSGAVKSVPVATPQNIKRTYGNLLPSLNLRYALSKDLIARFGAARVMSRPDLTAMTPTTSVNANVRTITSGNPNLKPFLSDQLDLSFEWYFNRESMLSAGLFYKKLQDFVINTSSTETVNVRQGVNGPLVATQFTRLQPTNAVSTRVKGLELGYQQPFSFLPSPFDGFGTLLNFTYIDAGKLPTTENGEPQSLPGVSKRSYTLTGYYEKYGFSAYLSYNYRSSFRGDPANDYFGDGVKFDAYGQWDLSLSQKVSPHVSVSLSITNLTNAALKQVDDFGYGRGYEMAGRRITAGLRADF